MDRRRWKISQLIIGLFQQGVSPEKIAWCLALGLVLGVFPMLGTTTLLCALAALLGRLNLPLIQLVNYLIYPLQLLLLLPFWRLGGYFFNSSAASLTLAQLTNFVKQNPWGAIQQFWVMNLEGIGAWAVLSAPVVFLLYGALLILLKRAMKARHV